MVMLIAIAGAFYVAVSRAMEKHNIAFSFDLTEDALRIDRSQSEVWRAQRREMERIRDAAMKDRRESDTSQARFCRVILQFCDMVLQRVPALQQAGVDVERVQLMRACAAQWQASVVDWQLEPLGPDDRE